MRKSIALVGTLVMIMAFSYGCATKDYVKQQTDPLMDRISKLEAASKNLQDCCNNAEGAAKRAEAAATKAQASAEKSKKAFELQQKKE